MTLVGAALLVLALVWQHVHATRLGYDVERTRRQTHSLRARVGALRMALETEVSPARLALQARARLGMQPAAPDALRALGATADVRSSESFLSRLLTDFRSGTSAPDGAVGRPQRSWRSGRPAT